MSAIHSTSTDVPKRLVTDDDALSYARHTLPSHLGWQPYTIQRLSGGNANYVYRIQDEKQTQTAILKYYDAYAAFNNNMELSQSRALIEYTALSTISIASSKWNTIVRVPYVYHYDDINYVICMEDIGIHTIALSTLLEKKQQQQTTSKFTFQQIAHELHTFLTHLFTLQCDTKIMSNPIAWKILKEWMSMFEKKRETYPQLAPFIDACQPFGPLKTDTVGWIHGDLWPNSIYLDEKRECIWLIDWEISRVDGMIAKNVTRDYQQLMMNLWVMLQNDFLFDISAVQTLMTALTLEFQGEDVRDNDWRTLGNGVCDVVRFITLLFDFPHWGITGDRATTSMNCLVQEGLKLSKSNN